MLPILQIGPLAIQTPGLIILIGLWIALELAERQAVLFGVKGSNLFSLIIWMLAAGLVGARIIYAATEMQIFAEQPLSLFALSPQMMNVPGGLVVALGAGLAYGQRAKLPLWPTLDAITMTLAVLLISLGLANFASGDAYGKVTTLPWAIDTLGARRHPTQVYETLAALAAAWAVWPGSLGRVEAWYRGAPGLRFWTWLSLSASGLLLLEAFRAESTLVMGQFHLTQIIAWLILALSLWQISQRGWSATQQKVVSDHES
jgi:phosphatidylglycerol:prolipoprotein diacylglycerol transferase